MVVESRNGTRVPITVVSDFLYFLIIPVFFWNILVTFLVIPLVYCYVSFILFPGQRLLNLLSRYRLINFPVLVFFNFFSVCAYYLLNVFGFKESFLLYTFAFLFYISSMMCIELLIFRSKNYAYTDVANFVFGFSGFDDGDSELFIPKGLVFNHWRSTKVFLWGASVTAFVLYNTILLMMLPASSLFFWLATQSVSIVFLFCNKEGIEHVASHSPKGRLVKLDGAGVLAWVFYLLEYFRRYIVWPFFLWFPDFYYLTHTLHHHVENNGPADWQSTLRYDRTSIFDCMKAVVFLPFHTIFPIDSAKYFYVTGRKKIFWRLMRVYAYGYAFIAVVAYICPFLAIALVLHRFAEGIFGFKFVTQWHGFHDRRCPYDIEASNNDVMHYAHHKKPGVHLYDDGRLKNIASNIDESKETCSIYKSDHARHINSNSRLWLLVQSLLWQKKINFLRHVVYCKDSADKDLFNYVIGSQLYRRSPWMSVLDNRISAFVGLVLERLLSKNLSCPQKEILYSP